MKDMPLVHSCIPIENQNKMLSEEQSKEIKKQIIQHIESTFQDNKKALAISQVESMDSKQLEEFIEKNNLARGNQSPSGEQCIFCAISSGNIQSYRIDENKNTIATLEINPISKGHVLIIPKKHSDKIPKELFLLRKKSQKK